MSSTSSLDLASLLCSRLCHDLLSPVGALTNGLELLAEETDPEMRQRCLELLEQSARISTDKLKFFRLAFGAAGGFGDMVPLDDARAVVDALAANNGRIEVNWQFSGDSLPKPAVKILLNFALMAIDALVRGGTIDIAAAMGETASELVVRASGTKVAFDPAIGHALDGTLAAHELSSRTAPAAMVRNLATSLGGAIRQIAGEDALVLGAELPLGG
ncbi:MAG: histidine phosphotransferase [Novosphingobium sp.]|nr:histidine phosphotransferase [Novosphingobium sp.]